MPVEQFGNMDIGEYFEVLFDYAPYAILIHDLEKITNVNQAFLRLHGYENKDDLIGKKPLETLVYKEDIEMVRNVGVQTTADSPSFIPTLRLLKSDGSIFIAEASVSSVTLFGKTHRFISSKDITESKLAEEALQESEKRYRNLFENSLDGIYKSTPAGKFVDVNPALVKMLGYDSEEELKQIDIKTELYFKIDDRKIMSAHDEDQYPLRRKDGSEIWVEDHSHYEYDEKGNIIFHRGILRDVSGKVEKQNQLTDLLSVTEDQNKRLQNFAHIVSHNIRSHSSNMSSLIQFMEDTDSNEERAKLFGMLKTSTKKLEETIENLNEIITVNRNLNKPVTLQNLRDEVNNTLEVLSGDIRLHQIKVDVKIRPQIEVKVIRAYLDSILLNIISNGIKYRSEKRESMIVIEAIEQKQFIVLSIRDNGIGIDLEKNKSKLFGMYKTFHDNEDSVGFGLYITKNQIEAMKGKIEVESVVDEGSVFKIFFNRNR